MSTTTEAATWPRVEATLHEDGTAEVSIGGSVQTINAQNVDEARPQVVALIAQRAAQLGRPLRALTRDPEGEWPIIIHGDGTVAEDVGAAARPRPPAEPQVIAPGGAVVFPSYLVPTVDLGGSGSLRAIVTHATGPAFR